MIAFGIHTLKDYARETPEARREAAHDINRMNTEKITASEASMIRLHDIMMSILKDMKEAYDSKPSDIETSQLTEMKSVMFKQAEEIRQKRPVTAEYMSNIIVNYLAQTGLDEKSTEITERALFADVQRYGMIIDTEKVYDASINLIAAYPFGFGIT